ncbi:MAG: CsgG/HfaB family protein [Myxococcales bacterium]|nr:CsgG/HfaB family protein [Myxococcales bacterium]
MRVFLALSLTLALPALAQAPTPTVAIASVDARGNATADEASEMNDALTAQLVADGRVRVVERQQLAKVMKEQALSQSGVMSDEVQVKLAQLVGARWIAVGSVGTKGRSLILSLRALDSSTAQVAYAENLKVGSEEQIEGGAKQLARKMTDKLLGPGAASSNQQASNEVIGDFDVGQVKDGAKALARSLAMRFPKLVGQVVEALPDGSVSCRFSGTQPFVGQFFEIDGKDEVTEQETKKGFFLLKSISTGGCSGKAKREPGAAITKGDSLNALPLKINLESLEPGPGTQPELAKLLADETRSALDTVPNFQVANDPQLTAIGRVSGPRGRRTVELQVIDKGGNVVQKLELPGSF